MSLCPTEVTLLPRLNPQILMSIATWLSQPYAPFPNSGWGRPGNPIKPSSVTFSLHLNKFLSFHRPQKLLSVATNKQKNQSDLQTQDVDLLMFLLYVIDQRSQRMVKYRVSLLESQQRVGVATDGKWGKVEAICLLS